MFLKMGPEFKHYKIIEMYRTGLFAIKKQLNYFG